jgi:effector-binding domain-containing protein
MTEFEVRDLAELAVATRRDQVPAEGLRDFFDESLPAVWMAVQTQGLSPAGPPFARYHGMPGATVDVETGFPVQGFTSAGDVQATTLPACRAAVAVHVGSYDGLAHTWEALMGWAGEQGLQRQGDDFWEVYLTDPGTEPDPSTWRTQLVQPIQ